MIVGKNDKTMFSFIRNFQTIFQGGCTIFAFPPARKKVSVAKTQTEKIMLVASDCFTLSLATSIIFSVLGFSHTDKCVVVSHCFKFVLPNDICVERLFMCSFASCMVSLVRCLLKLSSLPFSFSLNCLFS